MKTCNRCGRAAPMRYEHRTCKACYAEDMRRIRGSKKSCQGCRRYLPLSQFPSNARGVRCFDCGDSRAGTDRQNTANRRWRAARKYCAACRNYRLPSEFLATGWGARCNRCLAPTVPTKHAELDQRKQDATADFRFATEQLGISREQAIAWIAQGYGVTTRAVERWGIADEETAHEHR